jgi:hypothetical protein
VTVGAVLSWADFTKTRAQPEPASMPPGYAEDEPPSPDEVVADVQESRDGGLGAAALPFQEEERIAAKAEQLEREVVQPAAEAYTRLAPATVTVDGEPILPRPGRDDDVDDGLSGIGGEDLSEIPEHLRG